MKTKDIWKNQEVPLGSKTQVDNKKLKSLLHHKQVLRNSINRIIVNAMKNGVMSIEAPTDASMDVIQKVFSVQPYYIENSERGKQLTAKLEKLYIMHGITKKRINNFQERARNNYL